MGEVVAVGRGVTGFACGELVIAFPDLHMGAHAEYITMAAGGIVVPLPQRLSPEHGAALCFGGLTAQSFLDRAAAQRAERILIIGAAGTVGSAMAQLAAQAGLNVTAQTSTTKVSRVRNLGVKRVIDRSQVDFRTMGETWDIIADTVAASSFAECLPLLAPGGRYLAIAGGLSDLLARPKHGKCTIAGSAQSTTENLVRLAEQAQTGAFRPLIDRVLPFEAMPAAHAIVDGEGKCGSVVMRVAPA